MTFESRELSADQGRPVEFFTFSRDFQFFRFTSADRDKIVDGATFLARAITRSAIESSTELARGGIKVTGPRDLEVADLYRISPPSTPILVIVQQWHEGDGQLVTVWTGRIATVEFQGAASEITCEPIASSLRRVGLRRPYSRTCPHVLYGTACRVNGTAFRLTDTAGAIIGTAVEVPNCALRPDGSYSGGYIEYADAAGVTERRFILGHVGGTITLSAQPSGLLTGASVFVYPGCDHTLGAGGCSKFANVINYGGMPFSTKKNPFGGDPIY